MKKNIIKKNKVLKISSKKYKLKKKWRFWRAFKFFFLGRKKKVFFSKLQKKFDQRRIIRHQFLFTYGKNLYKLVLKKNNKSIFNKCFFNFLYMLEMRFSIFLIRINFCLTNLEATDLIKKGVFILNGKLQKASKLLIVGDMIRNKKKSLSIFNKKLEKKLSDTKLTQRIKKYRKRRRRFIKIHRKIRKKSVYKKNRVNLSKFYRKLEKYKWAFYKWKIKKKRNFFWKLNKNMVINFAEVNYRLRSCIILRNIIPGEYWNDNTNKTLLKLTKSRILKKIYFLY